jgi:hypothetical protein
VVLIGSWVTGHICHRKLLTIHFFHSSGYRWKVMARSIASLRIPFKDTGIVTIPKRGGCVLNLIFKVCCQELGFK